MTNNYFDTGPAQKTESMSKRRHPVSLKYALSENFLKIEFNTLRSILVPLKYTKYHTDKREKKILYIV